MSFAHFFVNRAQQLILIFMINMCCFAIATQPAWATTFAVRVFDGDNITLVDRGIKTKVHLACIDAPELLQPEDPGEARYGGKLLPHEHPR